MPKIISTKIPTGTIQTFPSNTIPDGWLICNGTALSTTTYSRLFSVIGYTYGNPGGGNFSLPDLRNKFPKGKGVAETLGATGGNNTLNDHTHTHTIGLSGGMYGVGDHSHPVDLYTGGTPGGFSMTWPNSVNNPPITHNNSGVYTTGAGSHNHGYDFSVGGSVGTGSSPSGTDNRPAFQNVNYIIKY